MKKQKTKKNRIIITGGHLTPALAVIDEIQSTALNDTIDIVFVGRKYAKDDEKIESFEYLEIKKRYIPFRNIRAGRVSRIWSIKTVLHLLKIPFGFFQAWQILSREKPNIVLTFGSYIGVPVALVAALLRIPVYVHEQTYVPGLATRIISKVAQTVFISFPESMQFFPTKKTILCGNPIRPEVFRVNESQFPLQKDHPLIYITGGALGSHRVNLHIEKIILLLLEKYIVIHQTGNVQQYNDYARIEELHAHMPDHLKSRYIVRKHIFASEIGVIYRHADIIVGRAGANTFSELVALKKPSVLIPLPWSGHGEQHKQAEILVRAGAAEIFDQDEPSEELPILIDKVYAHIDEYTAAFTSLEKYYRPKAASQIVDVIFR